MTTSVPNYQSMPGVGDKTLCAFNSLRLDPVESEQMPISLWDYLGGMGVVLQETIVQ